MISHPPKRVITFAVTALVALCHAPGLEARAQAGPGRGGRAKAASRAARPRPAGEDEKARELVEEGLRRADRKEWAEALKAFDRALAVSPRYADAYVAAGDTYVSMGKYAEGVQAYRQAIGVVPSNPDAHYGLGAAYNDMEQHADALKHLAQAVRLDPDFAEAHYGIGYAHLKREKYGEALAHLRRAARLRPDYWEAHLALGQTYLGLGDVKAAERELETLARLDALAARDLEREIKRAPAAGLPHRTGRDGPREGAPPLREKPAATLAAQEGSAGSPARAAARTQSVAPAVAQSQRAATPAAQNQNAAPARALVPAPRPAFGGDSALAVELSFWESVKDSGDPAEFAAYLKKFPEGQFAELARIRMRALAAKKGETSAESVTPTQQTPAEDAPTPAPTSAPAPAPADTPQPAAPTPAQSAARQQPQEELSAARPAAETPPKEPAKEQPAKDPATEQPSKEGEWPKEQAAAEKSDAAAEKPNSNEAADAADAATVEAALDSLRRLLPSRFSYKVRAVGGASAGEAASSEVVVNYEPLKFEECNVEWRDQSDALWVPLAELNPEAVRVEPRSRAGATFSIEVWNVSISAAGGKGAIIETKGDGSETANRYSGLDLQYDDRQKAERLARALRQAIKLCGGKP